MRLENDIDRDRRCRTILSLSTHLDELAAARPGLLCQLEEIDAQAAAAHTENNERLDELAAAGGDLMRDIEMRQLAESDAQAGTAQIERKSRLKKFLNELATARRALWHQLVDLDAHASAVRTERNTLRNWDAPIWCLPDEVLVMIFEEGMRRPRDLSYNLGVRAHFGVRVSHVTRRWRSLAISAPKLWTSIQCVTKEDDPPYPQKCTHRASTFLSRAGSLPIDILIEGFRVKDTTSGFLQLLGTHIENCHQLRITESRSLSKKRRAKWRSLMIESQQTGLARVLKCISSKPMPLLASIDINFINIGWREAFSPFGAPRLTTARIVGSNIHTTHGYLSEFKSLQSLQLGNLHSTPDTYHLLRDALMALPSLRHLELFLKNDIVWSTGELPILLPNIRHLHVTGEWHDSWASFDFLRCIQAPSLDTLSLSPARSDIKGRGALALIEYANKLHFPALQHLILINAERISDLVDLIVLARAFPQIERLTVIPGCVAETDFYNSYFSIDAILYGPGNGEIAQTNAYSGPLSPNLQRVAFSHIKGQLDIPRLQSTLLKLKAAGHPIRKLLLPQMAHPSVVEVEGIVELEEFYVDWSTPFDWGSDWSRGCPLS